MEGSKRWKISFSLPCHATRERKKKVFVVVGKFMLLGGDCDAIEHDNEYISGKSSTFNDQETLPLLGPNILDRQGHPLDSFELYESKPEPELCRCRLVDLEFGFGWVINNILIHGRGNARIWLFCHLWHLAFSSNSPGAGKYDHCTLKSILPHTIRTWITLES